MNGYTLPQIYGQLEYLEKNLDLVKEAVSDLAKNGEKTSKTLYGSLPKTNLSYSDFKKIRKETSSSWESKWNM